MQRLPVSGIIPINKPSGISSATIVSIIKRALYVSCGYKVKVGHMGTLDPMADGVLLIAVGKATRLFDLLSSKKKGYIAQFEFGKESDTLDITGEIICNNKRLPTLSEVRYGIDANIGDIMQYPPKYSAKSINGVKAYKLMRQGKDVELNASNVHIYNISLLSVNGSEEIAQLDNDTACSSVSMRIDCGSGTYIRSLGRDIAYSADTCAVMTKLTRIYSGSFSVKDSTDIDVCKEDPAKYIIPTVDIVAKYMNVYELPKWAIHNFTNGVAVELDIPDNQCAFTINDKIYAIAKNENNKFKAVINLWE